MKVDNKEGAVTLAYPRCPRVIQQLFIKALCAQRASELDSQNPLHAHRVSFRPANQRRLVTSEH